MLLLLACGVDAMSLTPMGTGVATTTHPNGFVQAHLGQGWQRCEGLAEFLADCADDAPAGVLLTAERAAYSTALPDGALALDATSRSVGVQTTLRALSERGTPVIAVADGEVKGAAAVGLFLSCSHRVCTPRALLSLPECRIGLCPASALAFRSSYGRHGPSSHVAMYMALTGAPLTAHDCVSLALATHFVQKEQLEPMLIELQVCPPGEARVPLERRTEPNAPRSQASLFADGVSAPLDAALRDVFGDAEDAADCLVRLGASLDRARMLSQSSAWHTRECADAVVDVLDGAERALRAGSPSAVAATFDVMRTSASLDAAAAQRLGLVVNDHLSGLDDFKELCDRTTGGAATGGAAGRSSRPRWQPAALDEGLVRRLADRVAQQGGRAQPTAR